MNVTRTNTGHIRVNGKWFNLTDVVNAAFDKVRASGSDNPAFDMPPFFYTGAPYAEAIIALGCDEVAPPKSYRAEYVPPLGEVWRSREPAWPAIFGVAPSQAAVVAAHRRTE